MDKTTKKILMYGVLILLMVMPLLIHNVSHADSGWDTGYSSSHSSSSHSSSSHSSSSHSRSSSGSSSSSSTKDWKDMNLFEKTFYVIFAGIGILMVVVCLLSGILAFGTAIFLALKGIYRSIVGYYKDMDIDRFKKVLPDYSMDELKDELYEKFIDIQNAWMNFEYDKLRELCTDELFNTYKAQLKALEFKKGQNIMSKFKKKEIKIRFARASEKYISVGIHLRVQFVDYVINTETKKVIMGSEHVYITNDYLMDFVKSKDEVNKVNKCPECGAKVNMVTSGECKNCGATIVVPPNEFVLSKKTNKKTE